MDRRQFILGSGVAFTTILAGCTGDTDDEDAADPGSADPDEAQADDDPQPDETESEDDEANGDLHDEADPEPQTFSGEGAEVHDDVEIEGGLTVVTAEHTGGSSNFQVHLVPSEGEFDELFVNEIGDYEGETAELLDADTYQLDVEADGSWRIEITQPRATSGDALPQSLADEIDAVFGPFEFDGSHTAAGEHSGEGNFIVHIYPPEGDFGELVFNEIGEYDGETTFRHDGVGYVAVEADGEWSLELE